MEAAFGAEYLEPAACARFGGESGTPTLTVYKGWFGYIVCDDSGCKFQRIGMVSWYMA